MTDDRTGGCDHPVQSVSWVAKLLRNSAWMGLAQAARATEALVRSVIVARALPVEGFAAYAVALAFVSLVTELANLNIGAVIVTYGARYRIEGNQLRLRALFKMGYAVTIVAMLFSVVLAAVLLHFSHQVLIHAPGLFLPTLALAGAAAFHLIDMVNKPILRLLERFRASCIGDLLVVPVNVAFLLVFMDVAEATPTQAIYAVAICMISSGVTSTVIAATVSVAVAGNWLSGSVRGLGEDARPMARMAIGNSISTSMQRAMRRGDVLLLAALSAPGSVAVYDIAKKVVALVEIPRMALALAVWPQISSDMAARRLAPIGLLLRRLAPFGLVVAGALWLGAWVCVEPAIVLIYGQKYSSAASVILVLLVASLVSVMFFWANAVLLSARRIKAQMLSYAVGVALLGVLGWLFAGLWAETGMAWAVVVATMAQFSIVALVTSQITRGLANGERDDSDSVVQRSL